MEQVERMCDSILLINRGKSVLEGNLKEVKSRYGRNTVQIEYEGDPGFLQQNGLVQSVKQEGPSVFVQLTPGADPQKLLHAAAERARLNKFELMEPSLEEIFIDVVGKANA